MKIVRKHEERRQPPRFLREEDSMIRESVRAQLIRPKCGAEMRSYERSEVVIDRCVECGEVSLDRGELERLIVESSNA
jgi:ribosomal protein L37AE/L43A